MKKVTVGCVVQHYNKKGKCTSQEFVAVDQVDWETDDGTPCQAPSKHEYHYFEMVQPKQG